MLSVPIVIRVIGRRNRGGIRLRTMSCVLLILHVRWEIRSHGFLATVRILIMVVPKWLCLVLVVRGVQGRCLGRSSSRWVASGGRSISRMISQRVLEPRSPVHHRTGAVFLFVRAVPKTWVAAAVTGRSRLGMESLPRRWTLVLLHGMMRRRDILSSIVGRPSLVLLAGQTLRRIARLDTIRLRMMDRLGLLTMRSRLRGVPLISRMMKILIHSSSRHLTPVLCDPTVLVEVLLDHGHHPHRTHRRCSSRVSVHWSSTTTKVCTCGIGLTCAT